MDAQHSALELLQTLHHLDDRLQEAMQSFLDRYYRFLESSPTGKIHGTRHLRLRCDRDSEERIRGLPWTRRIRPTQLVDGQKKHLTKRLLGRLQHPWVHQISRDWEHLPSYKEFEKERLALTSARSGVVKLLRAIRLSFEYRWSRQASPEDHLQAQALLHEPSSRLWVSDLRALPGVLAFARHFHELETSLGIAVEEFRRTLGSSVPFELVARLTESGTLRLTWGHSEHWPTDKFMRSLRLPAPTRREVGAFVKRLHGQLAPYRQHCRFMEEVWKRAEQVVDSAAAIPAAASLPAWVSLAPPSRVTLPERPWLPPAPAPSPRDVRAG